MFHQYVDDHLEGEPVSLIELLELDNIKQNVYQLEFQSEQYV